MNNTFKSGSIFNVLGSIFKKHNIQAILVGGYAVITYKVQRMTFDIDILLTTTDFEKVENDIVNLGYSYINKTDAFVQLKNSDLYFRDLDFILTDENTYQKICNEGMLVTIAQEKFIVPSIFHIIAMKLHAITFNPDREMKDLADIVQLIANNQLDPKEDKIKVLFLNYNANELYEKVLKAIN